MTQLSVQQAIDLARQYHGSRQLAEAESLYRQIVTQLPTRHDLLQDLAQVLYQSGKVNDALETMRRAVAMAPQAVGYRANLAMILATLGQFEPAIREFQQVLSAQPNMPEAWNNLGIALRETGRCDEAIPAFRRAIELRPDYADAKWNLSFVPLAQGNFREGLPLYEARLQMPSFPNRHFTQPMWDGTPLNGRRILLHAEQGMGDTFNFIRYAPMVAQRGGKVIVLCQPETKRLLQIQRLDVEQWIADGEELPAFDVHCPLLSLPKIFNTIPENIPANVPYLHADPALANQWRNRLAEYPAKLKVGLVWGGNLSPIHNRKRSTTLAALAPLATARGVLFVSLQKGDAAKETLSPPAGMTLVDWSRELRDFADTAALIAALDLVITIDTGVAHLAGAMGKPTWVLLPFVPDWRWLLQRSDSPWYPTMRLFRQPRLGEWQTPIKEIAVKLKMTNDET